MTIRAPFFPDGEAIFFIFQSEGIAPSPVEQVPPLGLFWENLPFFAGKKSVFSQNSLHPRCRVYENVAVEKKKNWGGAVQMAFLMKFDY